MSDRVKFSLLTEHMEFEPDQRDPAELLATNCAIHSEKRKMTRETPLLKTLLSSNCERNCNYCPFRAGRDIQRATLEPDEMASLYVDMYNNRQAGGLFLSSAIHGNSIKTQDKLIDTGTILRRKRKYQGYLHLKMMPGSERDQVLETMKIADRVSINLEGANPNRLKDLAPRKNFIEELLQPLRWAEEIRQTMDPWLGWKGHWPSLVTQFVVGAVGDTDLELLDTSRYLFSKLHLSIIYYSAFRPVENTPLDGVAPVDAIRQFRLYQASFLLNQYGFDLEDMPFEEGGNLALDRDPKIAWADANLSEAPIEINRAGRAELLRIPGIGPKTATAILQERRLHPIADLSVLRALGVNINRSVPYILLNGHRPAQQLALW